jgi:pyruvate/2-oxoglutarate dehydrogenase complex dihydrolipoamide acyltransferase (E2) component
VSTPVAFPQLSNDDPHAQGVVGTWFAGDGESVTAGQLIAEVQVDKVSADVHAPASGVLRHVVAEEGETNQGETIATID